MPLFFSVNRDKMKMVLALLVLLVALDVGQCQIDWVALARESQGNQEVLKLLDKVFDFYDTNESGSWSLEEFKFMFKFILVFEEIGFDWLFEYFDKDVNGELSKDEGKKLIDHALILAQGTIHVE